MIEIIPAIDLIDGKCVRLTKGDYDTKKVYDENPLDVAKRFEDVGLKRLHLVDLDGARQGKVINYKILDRICHKTNLAIDFGGGLRSDKDLQIAFESGAKQVNIGSVAVKDRPLCISWLKQFGSEKVILSADVKGQLVSVSGWQEESKVFLIDFLHEYREEGIIYVACTDIAKDGMLSGPSFELYKEVLGEVEGIKLIASGGVEKISDVEMLDQHGLYAVIIGKAIYEGRISLKDLTRFIC